MARKGKLSRLEYNVTISYLLFQVLGYNPDKKKYKIQFFDKAANKMFIQESNVKVFEDLTVDGIPEKYIDDWSKGMAAARSEHMSANETLSDSDTSGIGRFLKSGSVETFSTFLKIVNFSRYVYTGHSNIWTKSGPVI